MINILSKWVNELFTGSSHAVSGLIDGHTHIEMSMLSVREFAKAVVPRGTTAVVADPHELDAEIGGIAPGKIADIILLKKIETFEVDKVLVSSQLSSVG